MPHLVMLYSQNLEREVDFSALTRAIADTMIAQRDSLGKQVFPTGGTRVFAYPAPHSAIADGKGDYGFLYANLRMASGRTPEVHKSVGDEISAVLKSYMSEIMERKPVGITVQIDESPGQVYDNKMSSLHPLFR